MTFSPRKIIALWLLAGTLMVFFQVIVGGVTRLTESGLSITEWKPIKGIIPPLNDSEWNSEFDLYKQKPQYKMVNEGMTPGEFKWIYFWEYFHRFWARFMGIVFAAGFIFFLSKNWVDRDFMWRVAPLFIWGGVEGVYGWFMVSRGLRGIFVPPLHLAAHLVIALSLYAYLVLVTLYYFRGKNAYSKPSPNLKIFALTILALLFVQAFFGGLMSGMKAGLAYPTWPDMNGSFIPSLLFSEAPGTPGLTAYNPQDLWGRTLIQVLHRFTAYALVIMIIIFYLKTRRITADKVFRSGLNFLPLLVLLQALIGIVTLLHCIGSVPVFWGVLHQAGAMILIADVVLVIFHLFSKGPLKA